MADQSTQQEVLLLTGTSFSARQGIDNEPRVHEAKPDEQTTLEQACWNGQLPTMLPEICGPEIMEGPVYIWKIREGSTFLEVELGDSQKEIDAYYSLDPYAYSLSRNYN
ncbi:MAG: hypothetical protein ABW174_02370 [Flavitalea sp.]